MRDVIFSALPEPLERVLAHRFEQLQTRPACVMRLDSADEPALYDALQRIEKLGVVDIGAAHACRGCIRATADKYTHMSKDALVGVQEQLITPVKRGPERAAPTWRVSGPIG